MGSQITIFLHYLSWLLLFALLGSEHLLINRPLDALRVRRLVIIDIAYGSSASLVLFSGAAWVLWYGKGLDYYLYNSLLQIKVGLFLLVGALATLPTLAFLNWRTALLAEQAPDISKRLRQWVILCIRLELGLLLIILLLSVLMADDFGALKQ